MFNTDKNLFLIEDELKFYVLSSLCQCLIVLLYSVPLHQSHSKFQKNMLIYFRFRLIICILVWLCCTVPPRCCVSLYITCLMLCIATNCNKKKKKVAIFSVPLSYTRAVSMLRTMVTNERCSFFWPKYIIRGTSVVFLFFFFYNMSTSYSSHLYEALFLKKNSFTELELPPIQSFGFQRASNNLLDPPWQNHFYLVAWFPMRASTY